MSLEILKEAMKNADRLTNPWLATYERGDLGIVLPLRRSRKARRQIRREFPLAQVYRNPNVDHAYMINLSVGRLGETWWPKEDR